MFCPNCGFKSLDDAKFCKKCGTSLESSNNNEESAPTNNENEKIEVEEVKHNYFQFKHVGGIQHFKKEWLEDKMTPVASFFSPKPNESFFKIENGEVVKTSRNDSIVVFYNCLTKKINWSFYAGFIPVSFVPLL